MTTTHPSPTTAPLLPPAATTLAVTRRPVLSLQRTSSSTFSVTRFQIAGLAGRYDYSLDFSPSDRITFLTGPNGSGKSVILRLMAAMLSGLELGVSSVPFDLVTMELSDGRCMRLYRQSDSSLRWLGCGFGNPSSVPLLDCNTVLPPSSDITNPNSEHSVRFLSRFDAGWERRLSDCDGDLSSFSSGERRLLLLARAIDTAHRDRSPLLLLDGIESEIHERWRRELSRTLLSCLPSCTSVIWATHSPTLKHGDWANTIDLYESLHPERFRHGKSVTAGTLRPSEYASDPRFWSLPALRVI